MDALRLCCLLLLLCTLGASQRYRRQDDDGIDDPNSNQRCRCKDNNGTCYCVHYQNCNADTDYVWTEGEVALQPRIDLVIVPTCERTLEVCCHGPPDEDEEPIPPVPTPPVPIPPSKGGCGVRRTSDLNNRIMGDDNGTFFGEYPWMAVVLTTWYTADERPNGTVFKCGATLLSHQVALTAAHCVFNWEASELFVRAGDWDLSRSVEPLRHQERDVKKVIRHPEYTSGSLLNDLALLVLDKPLDSGDNIDVACLPDQGAQFTGQRCIVTGWGVDKETGGNYQAVMKKIEMPVVDSLQCQSKLRTTRLSRFFRLNKSFICAGGESNTDACVGDGGGPLLCSSDRDPERYVQAGIVSWGIGCGRRNLPAAFTNMGLFVSWIDSEIAKEGLTNEAKQP